VERRQRKSAEGKEKRGRDGGRGDGMGHMADTDRGQHMTLVYRTEFDK